jgi:type II secretory pathway component PulF
MIFTYQAIDEAGKNFSGTIDAVTEEVAISSLQRRGLTVVSISDSTSKGLAALGSISLFDGVSNRDLVILSRQIATLFEAQVSALRIFRLLAEQAERPMLRTVLTEIADDLQGGNQIGKALSKHPKVFSDFYVNMVRAGEILRRTRLCAWRSTTRRQITSRMRTSIARSKKGQAN